MPILLHISASSRGERSESRRYGRALVARLAEVYPGLRVLRRDLADAPPAHPDCVFAEASLLPATQRQERDIEALALSERLIGEIEAADLIAIDTPMHNFTVPSVLKAWIDFVVRPGRTFRGTRDGKVGLFPDRPVYVIITSGGPLGEEEGRQRDFASPYLHYVLNTIGLRAIFLLRLDSLRRGPEAVASADVRCDRWLATLPLPSMPVGAR